MKVLATLLGGAAAGSVRTAPDVEAQVAADNANNIQIHDSFVKQEQNDGPAPVKKPSSLLQFNSNTAPDVSEDVARERQENLHITDTFKALENADDQTVKKVKKTAAFLQTGAGPDVADQVAQERGENIQLHDTFVKMEQTDTEEQKAAKARTQSSLLSEGAKMSQTSTTWAGPDVTADVEQERNAGIHIADPWKARAASDEEGVKAASKVKA